MAELEQLIRIKLDDESIRREIQGFESQIEQLGATIRPKLQGDQIDREFQRLSRSRTALSEDIKFNAIADLDDSELQAVGDQRVNVDVELNVDDSELNTIRGETETVDVDLAVDDSELDRVRSERLEIPVDLSGVGEAFGDIDTAAIGSGLGAGIGGSLADALSSTGPQGAAVATAGLALGGLFAAAFSEAIDFGAANDRLAAQLDLTSQEAEIAGRIAGDVYAGAWGESLDEVNEAVRGVIGVVGDLNDSTAGEVEQLTGLALDLASAFDQDVNEVIRATTALMRNDLADSGEEAFDIIARGFTQAGVQGDDLLETFSEYSNQLADASLSAADFLAFLDAGLEAGARSSDGIADVLKELNLNLTAGAEGTRSAVESLGISFTQVQGLLDEGQGFEAVQLVSQAVSNLNSETERQAVLQELLGGTYEQAGADAVLAFGNAERSIDGLDGAAARLSTTLNDNLSVRLTGLQRSIQVTFAEIGLSIFDFVDSIDFGPLLDAVEPLGDALGEAFDETFLPAAEKSARFLAEDFAPVFVNTIVPAVEGTVDALEVFIKTTEFLVGNTSQAIDLISGAASGISDFLGIEGDGPSEQIERSAEAITRFRESEREIDYERFRGGMEGAGEAAGEAARSVEEVEAAMDALQTALGVFFTFSAEQTFAEIIETNLEWASVLGDLSTVAVDASGSIDLFGEAGRRLQAELINASGAVQDLGEQLIDGQISATEFNDRQGLLIAGFREAAIAAGLQADEIDALVARYFEIPESIEQEIKLLADTADAESGIARVDEQASSLSGKTFSTTLDADDSPAVARFDKARGEGARWAQDQFTTAISADDSQASARFASARGEGARWARDQFTAAIAADDSPADAEFGKARTSGERWARSIYEAQVRARDNASSEIDRIVRDREVNVRVRLTGNLEAFQAGRRSFADGGIMTAGSGLDGIARSRSGGVSGVFGGRPFVMAENGGDELFLNSKSPLERQIDLIERFANGRLDRELKDHYAGGSGPTVINVYASTPVQDQVLAGQEIARQVEHQLKLSNRRITSSNWGPR